MSLFNSYHEHIYLLSYYLIEFKEVNFAKALMNASISVVLLKLLMSLNPKVNLPKKKIILQ